MISKGYVTPAILALYGYVGVTPLIISMVYSSVLTPLRVFVAPGLPMACVATSPAFSTVVNCSSQFSFVVSFHASTRFLKFVPVLSNTVSLVLTLSNFK